MHNNFYNQNADEMAVAAVHQQQRHAGRQYQQQQQMYTQQQMMMQQGMMQQQEQFDDGTIPEPVVQFLKELEEHVENGDEGEILNLYENTFNKLTDQFYKQRRWPSVEMIESVIENDVVVTLYKELFYRHVYSKMQPTFEDRLQSWLNYCSLFDYFLEVELDPNEEDGGLKLPAQWLWDMLDEFIYQFQTWPNYIAKTVKTRNADFEQIKENFDMWDARKVMWYLHEFADKSQIREYLHTAAHLREDRGNECDAFHNEFARHLGYYSVVGLTRMHCLFGDYYLALKMLDDLDLKVGIAIEKPLYFTATACHITVFYYMGFAYLMMRRYSDAIRTFTDVLGFLTRTRQFYTASYQYDNMVKKMDQMFALLMICHSLCPISIEDGLHQHIKEKFHEKLQGLQRGDQNVFEEIFSFSCPKFVSPAVHDFEHPQSLIELLNEPFRRQLDLFKREIREQRPVPQIRSNLKFYSTIPIEKLSQLTDNGDGNGIINALMCAKHKQHQVVKNLTSGEGPMGGSYGFQGEIDYDVDDNMVHINTTKTGIEYADIFTQQIGKFADLLNRAAALKIDDDKNRRGSLN